MTKSLTTEKLDSFGATLFSVSGLLWCLLFPIAKAPSNIAAVLVTLMALFALVSITKASSVNPLREKNTIAALLLMLLPAIWFLHPGPGPYGAYLKDTLFGLYMLAMAFWTRNHPDLLPKAVYLLLAGTVFSASISLMQHFSLIPQKDAGSSLGLHNGTLTGAFSLLLVFTAGLLTFVIRYSQTIFSRALAGVGLLICIADLFLVVPGRTGYLAFLVMSGFMLYNLSKLSRVFAVILVLIVTAFVLNSSVFKQRIAAGKSDLQLYSGGTVTTSMGARFEMWKVSWRNFTETPLIGSGTNGFSPRWMREGYSKIPYAFNNPHSTYFHLLGNYGISGFAVLVFFLWRLAVTAWRFRETLAGAATGAFLIVFVVGGLTNTMLTGDFYLAWLALIAGMASGLKIKEIHEVTSKD
ncbi:O-antigen ligase [Trichlorobacter thiogenes]|uniref:O-antigen ligase n=1 Tax=Trichlorobacter thiogenes TaxID=115783 RepID=A0A1T4RFB4_9BACT|nr:O-antigen ligase family protein [Trichlorobacter thiogenes]SKA14623.1 O-antigen ligase [Trichlorobacter thiogenes]